MPRVLGESRGACWFYSSENHAWPSNLDGRPGTLGPRLSPGGTHLSRPRPRVRPGRGVLALSRGRRAGPRQEAGLLG